MRKFILFAAAAALLGTAASAVTTEKRNDKGEAALAKLIAGRTPGKPVDCIPSTLYSNSTVIDGTAIVYQNSGRTLYVNRPRSGAPSLNDDDILVTRQWGSQLCNLDMVHLVDRASRFPRGFVSLGQFVPYTRPKTK
jgi:hypothetical protein